MKLVATVIDGNAYYHMGLDIEAQSAIIEIENDKLPKIVKEYLKKLADDIEFKRPNLTTLRFSILDESGKAGDE